MKKIILFFPVFLFFLPIVFAHGTCGDQNAEIEVMTDNDAPAVGTCETQNAAGDPCYAYRLTASDFFQSYLIFNLSKCDMELVPSDIVTAKLNFSYIDGVDDIDFSIEIIEEDKKVTNYSSYQTDLKSTSTGITGYYLGDGADFLSLCDTSGSWNQCLLDYTTEVKNYMVTNNSADINRSITFRFGGNATGMRTAFYVDDYTQSSSQSSHLYLYTNKAPKLNCPDQQTSENGNASDINLDLWSCLDDDDTGATTTFYIAAESHTALIDCNITSSRYLRCNPPAVNRTGFSDVFVRAIDDGSKEGNQTIRVTINGTAEVTLDINGAEAWVGYHGEPKVVDIRPEIEKFLDICVPDSDGACIVPLRFYSNFSTVDMTINWLSIAYFVPYFEFTQAAQNYVTNQCDPSISTCLVPLTFGTSTQGVLNLTNIQFYFTNNTLPTIENLFVNTTNPNNYTNGTVNVSFSISDPDGDSLIYKIDWYLNNLLNMTFANQTNISAGNTTKGDNFTAIVAVYDGTNWGANKTGTVIIQNTEPILGRLVINSSAGTNSTTENISVFNVTLTFDEDNDTVKNIYNWYYNDTPYYIAYLPFEGGSNDTFTKDFSGYGNHGNVSGGASGSRMQWNSSGGYDRRGAYTFDGIDSHITLPNTTHFTTDLENEFTIMAWVYQNDDSGTSGEALLGSNGTDINFRNIQLLFNPPNNRIVLRLTNGTANTVYGNDSTIAPAQTWFHVAVTYKNGSYVRIYINGTKRLDQSPLMQLIARRQFTFIGTGSPTGALGDWNGTIDEFILLNRSLTDEQIRLYYSNQSYIISSTITLKENWTAQVYPADNDTVGPAVNATLQIIGSVLPTQGNPIINSSSGKNITRDNITIYNQSTVDADNDLVKNIYNWYEDNVPLYIAYLPFEGGSNATFTKDYSSLNNDGTVNGPTWISSSGYDGWGAYNFSGGAANNISLRNSSASNITKNQLTLVAWIKVQGSGTRQILARAAGENATQRQYGLYVTSTGALGFETRTSFGGVDASRGFISNNVWTHVAGVYDGSNMVFYINGVQVGTSALQAGNIVSQITNTTIGEFPGGLSKFSGVIDEVMILNRSLSSQQILLIAQNKTHVIHSSETFFNDTWTGQIYPNDGSGDGVALDASLTVINSKPTQGNPTINSSTGLNVTTDNITIYNVSTADTNNEPVKNIYNWFVNDIPFYIAYLPFEGGSDSSLTKDYSSGNHGGEINGLNWNLSGGYDGRGAYSFSGVGNNITLRESPNGTTLNITGNQLTLAAWVKVQGSGFRQIIARAAGTNTIQRQFGLYITNTNALGFETRTSSGTVDVSRGSISNDVWTHVAGVYDGNNMTFYINGVQVGTNASQTGNIVSQITNVTLGEFPGGVSRFAGTIDEVMILNMSLSAQQILLIYQNKTYMIHSSMTTTNDTWKGQIYPNDGSEDGIALNASLTVI